MADPHVDRPGEIHWFKRYGPADLLGPCPHIGCRHKSLRVIAWGPDYRRYTLDQCDEEPGCGGSCRAWHSERSFKATSPWLHVSGGQGN